MSDLTVNKYLGAGLATALVIAALAVVPPMFFEKQPPAKPGYAVAEEGGYAVVVTTDVTPELAAEGLARELVRRIQEMRKDAGFEIADRIRLYHAGDDEIARVVDAWGDYIRQETLAAAIGPGAPPAGAHIEEHAVDGRKVMLAVDRV